MSGRERRERHQRAVSLEGVARIAIVAVVVLAVAGIGYLVLRNTSAFTITSIEAPATDHVSAEDLNNLIQVPEGSTLLNVDTSAIEEAVKQDPWVASVSFERKFPSTLKVVVHEQKVDALVVMGTGSVAWYLGDAGIWIQPTKVEAADGQSVTDAALAKAQAEGCLLITDVPATVDPEAGSVATDDVITAVQAFQAGFSDSFRSQIVSYSAPSDSAVACVLKNGVYVSLGSADRIQDKERVVSAYFSKYGEGTILSINVRDPDSAAVKPVDSTDVQAGDGVTAQTSTQDGSAGSDGGSGDGSSGNSGDSGNGSSGSDGSDGSGSPSDSSGTSSGTNASSGTGSTGSTGTSGTSGTSTSAG